MAVPVREFDVNGLITGASISPDFPKQIALIGYTENLVDLFMWVLYGYPEDQFFLGNTRRFSLGKSIDFFDQANNRGQIEGVTFTSGGQGYISSERINRRVSFLTFVVEPHLYSFSIEDWVPLPVELLGFRAFASPAGFVLTWETASETASDYFRIERSADAVHFTEIGRQKAAGNSSALLRYRFTDPAPLAGANYYRLKQTDQDKTFSYSSVVSATAKRLASGIQVYPVPVSIGQPLTVQILAGQGPGSVLTLTGMDGKAWLRREVAAGARIEETLAIEHIKPGVYLLQITSDTQWHRAKVVVR